MSIKLQFMTKIKINDLIILNPEGNIEVIEFFDYHCGHCKSQARVIDELLKDRKDIKVILRPIPILGEQSLYAIQIGYAILLFEPSKFQGYYSDCMINVNIDGDFIYNALNNSGINIKKLKEVLENKKEEIDSIIEFNMDSANKFGIRGTPSFVINGDIVVGELNLKNLINLLYK